MHPVYKITIDPNDPETQVEFNALVDVPAHMKAFEAYGKKNKDYFANEENRMVTGVMISADTLIYRNDSQLGEHYVYFDSEAIKQMWLRFNKNNFVNRVNEQHDPKKIISSIYMVEQWRVDSKRGMGVPASLANQGIKDGSWIATYKIENDEVWNKVKDGTFNGFSVEGLFLKQEAKVKKVDDKYADIKLYHKIKEILYKD